MASERVVLIDGTALIFRAFFAIPGTFRTTTGIPTNATYGFALMFRKLLEGKTPAYGAVIFDAPGRTFRDERYPQYKAQRPRMQPDMRTQIPWIHKVVEAHDYPLIEVSGYEADDVIGTLAREAVEAGHEVHIISGDKDFAQLVGPKVRMVDTVKDVSYDSELVRKKWGVTPDKFIDYLALIGDKSDNIPGVPGIGPKSAKKLLETYGDLEGVLAHTDELKGKQKERLVEHADDARLSKELATIDQHVPMDFGLEAIESQPVDIARVDALYRELEFFSLLSGDDAQELAKEGDLGALESMDDAKAFVTDLVPPVAVFPIAAGPSVVHGTLVGCALASVPAEGDEVVARYLPIAGEGGLGEPAKELLKGLLEDDSVPKVTHDLREVDCIFRGAGIAITRVVGDTRLASFLVDPTRDIPHRLDQITRTWLHRTLLPIEDLLGSGKKRKALTEVPLDELGVHAAHLVAAAAEAWPVLAEALEDEGHTATLADVSMPLAYVLARMQRVGVRVDPELLGELEADFVTRRDDVEAEVHELAGGEFNLGSSKQLGAVLFDELELPVLKKTKTGYSTAAGVLERLAPKHPIAEKVLDWRALAKLVNTYTRVLREAIAPEDERVHATFQQTVGASGRLITTDPDIQRTPIRTKDGKRIREAFVPREGWVMVSADWSQIELRLVAHVTGDERLAESFRLGEDVHRRTAAGIYDIAPEDVDATQRNVGKTVNFATIYGQGATALGQSLDISRKEAKALIDRYFEVYSGVRTWLDETVAQAHEDGFVETMLGRRRYIPELSSNNFTDRAYGERIATNTPIQGSAADLCKLAMLAIATDIEGMEAEMLLQIHDELIFECPPAEVEALTELVKRHMETVVELDVPLVADVGHGASWAEAH
ncbi:MAG: DNA polymerase I [Deltaproteobacteria bacterium]|nr:DNA polymerase I [Deltaproteobacteria bacterium]